MKPHGAGAVMPGHGMNAMDNDQASQPAWRRLSFSAIWWILILFAIMSGLPDNRIYFNK